MAIAVLAAAEVQQKDAEKKRKPVAPMDIVYGTAELMYDIYDAAYAAADGMAHKHGVHAKAKDLHKQAMTHVTGVIGEDPIESACGKLGCKAKDITDKLSQTQAFVMQVKAQAHEHGAKASDHLTDFASKVVTKFEMHVPSYKGVVPKTFMNLLLVALYVLFVFYIIFRIVRFALRVFFSIFCGVCCCCCRQRKQTSEAHGKKNGKKVGHADAKASIKSPTKGKAKP